MFVKLEEVFGSSINPINEAFHYTGEEEFHKAFAKATGFKTHAGGYFGPSNGSAHIKINLYDCLTYNKRLPRPGVYGDLEIKRVTPMNEYEQAKLDIVYQGVEMELGIGAFYPPRVAKAKNKQVIDLILKHAGIKADYDIVIKSYRPFIELGEEDFNKLAKIKEGDKIGDFLVYDAGMETVKSVEEFYIIMTSYEEQFCLYVDKKLTMNESEMNESVKVFNDAAKLIAGYLNIKFKPTGTPDVFEVSGRDRMKIEKLQEGDILDNNMMVDGIVDDNYTVNIELRKPGMSRAIIVRFTDEPEMFESVDEKTFLKDFSKATGLKVSRESEIYDDNTGLVFIDSYAAAQLRYSWVKRGSKYGDFELRSITPSGYRDFDAVVSYKGEDYNLRLDNSGSPRISADKAKSLAEQLLKDMHAKSVAMGKLRGYCVTDVDSKTYQRLRAIKPGNSFGQRFGDCIFTDVGKHPNGVYGGSPFIVEAVTAKGFVELVFRNADELEELKKDAQNFSSEMSESTLFADLSKVDEKTLKDIVKSTFKVLGTKVGRDVSVYDNCIEVTTSLITTAKLETGVVKMGNYSGIKFVSYEEGKSGNYDRLIVEYNSELYPIALLVREGYAGLRFAKAGELLKDFSKKYRISTDNADVNPYSKANTLIQVSEAEFKKLPSLVHRGDTIGDAVVVGVGEDSGETRLFRGKNFHVTIVTPKHQAGFTFIPENYVSGLREDEAGDMNESTVELNEVTGLPKHKTSVPSHML